MTDTTLPKVAAYRAADLMEHDGPCVPKLNGRRSLFKVAGLPRGLETDGAYLPTWNWENPYKATEYGRKVVELDCTAAFVAAATSGTYAHGAYTRTGPNRFSDTGPGYYRTQVQPWEVKNIPHPLGSAGYDLEVGSWVWVMQPTLSTLEEACENWGYWKSVNVDDSYTAVPGRDGKPNSGRILRKWGERVRDDRKAVRERLNRDPEDLVAAAEYKAVKDGYSMAVQMWNTPYDPPNTEPSKRVKKNETYRPDWFDTLHATHAANMWRRAWNTALPPFSMAPVAMGDRDAITFFREDVEEMLNAARPPFRYDPSGMGPGTFKVKRTYTLEAPRG